MPKPDATAVAGSKKWQTLGSYVRKGGHGIPIPAPIFASVEKLDGTEEQKLVGFKVVYVFDIGQTDGKPLPEPPEWKSPEQNALLTNRLVDYAESQGIKVQVKELGGDVQGVSLGGTILLSPLVGTRTLIHEIAHEPATPHRNRPVDHTMRELEAESDAYVVGKHFGLNGLSSPIYNALQGATLVFLLEE